VPETMERRETTLDIFGGKVQGDMLGDSLRHALGEAEGETGWALREGMDHT
jgi:hypothetical protein